MNVFVVTIESASDVKLLGMYANEKLAKAAMHEFVDTASKNDETTFTKKIPKKEAIKKLMFEYTPAKGSEKERLSVFMMSGTVEGIKATGKAKKDPLAPKRCLTAYMLFANDNREKLMNDNPDTSFGDINKKLGVSWSQLADEERQVYHKKAAEDKVRYEKEMAAYTEVV